MATIISATSLVKRYEETAPPVIDNLDLRVDAGDFAVIMGSSGSGKSTLLYLLCGIEHPTSGSVRYGETELSSLGERESALLRRKGMGFVFQDAGLVPQLTLLENVVVPGRLADRDGNRVVKRARDLLARVGIADLADRLPAQVSGGELQRCAIARALVNSPAVVFADEPTGNLNSAHSTAVLDILRELHRGGQTILMVTHELKAACQGRHVLFLRDGSIRDEFMQDDDGAPIGERERRLFQWLTGLGW
jgi:putative ABC transport system ATP-binding protein